MWKGSEFVCHGEACCVKRYTECVIGMACKEVWFWFSDLINTWHFFRYLKEIGYNHLEEIVAIKETSKFSGNTFIEG
jgi:hypothetical protein